VTKEELIKQLEAEIATNMKAIKDAREIIESLQMKSQPAAVVQTGVFAIGDSPRGTIITLCQSRGMGMPVDLRDLVELRDGCTWGKSFQSDTNKFEAFGVEIPGGFGISVFENKGII